MSSTQLKPLPAWAQMQINAKPAWMALLLNWPVTRLFYHASRAASPMLPLQHEVEIYLYPHDYQRVSLVRVPRTWAKARASEGSGADRGRDPDRARFHRPLW